MSEWTLCRFGENGLPYNDPVTERALPMDDIETLEQDESVTLFLNSEHLVHVHWNVGRKDDIEWFWVRR